MRRVTGRPARRRQISRPTKVSRPRGIYLALGLLTACAVFAATAGVREALVTRTQALRQTLAAASSSSTDITVSAASDAVSAALNTAGASGPQGGDLTDAQVTEITGQLHADYDGYDHGIVSLAPATADWASLTSGLNTVQSKLPAVGGIPVKLELTYRQPLSQHMRLVAGHFPAPPAPAVPVPGAGRFVIGPDRSGFYTPLLQVVVTQPTAATFGLRVGSKVRVGGPQGLESNGGAITFQVSGIVVPTDPASSFWTAESP